MSDKQETIADIIAEMRERCIDEQHSPTLWPYFARLEAAHRRELAASGNAAKLREALTDAEKTLYDSSRSMYGIPPHLHALLARIRAALSAPPRNCDRFATVDEARKAHEEYRGDYIMRASNKFDFPMKFEAWLFAPATEKEGGNNGK